MLVSFIAVIHRTKAHPFREGFVESSMTTTTAFSLDLFLNTTFLRFRVVYEVGEAVTSIIIV